MYSDIVRNITRRQMSFDSDALNACAGIFKVDQRYRAARGENPEFAFGLPIAMLTLALCWMTKKQSPGRRRSDFPSWSWAGWDTAASYEMLENRRSRVHSHYDASMLNEPEDIKAAALIGPRPIGNLDPTCPLLAFWTTSATLRVDRTSRNSSLPNCFAISSPHDPNLFLGHILLAEPARACRPDEMEFIVIGIESGEDRKNPGKHVFGVKLLCIEWIGDVAQRVQMTYHLADGPFEIGPSEGSLSLENWRAVKPVEKSITLG